MSIWYKTGTVSVTNGSQTISGTGTAFVSNVQPGQEFRLQGAAYGYEIEAVVSDTELTIARPYLEASGSAQTYLVVPVRGFAQRAAAALQSAISTMQGHINGSLAGLFPDGTSSAPGLRFSEDPDTGLRRPANNEVSLVAGGGDQLRLGGGVATGSAVQQSSTDTTAGRLMRVDYGFSPGNLIGIVSESAGTPTGAVFERGGNTNGEYVRFADGTQICTGSFTLTGVACSSAYAGGYRNVAASSVTFPAAFSAVPAVHHAPSSLAASDAMSLGHGGISALVFSPRIWRTDVGTVNYEAKFTAIGRWFN